MKLKERMLWKDMVRWCDSGVNLFIDSVVWIGAKLKNDQWHEEPVKIINKFINNGELIFVKGVR